MIGWIGILASAHAEPVALRGPHAEPTVVVGLHDISVGSGASPVAVAVSMRTDRGAVDVAVGRRWRMRGDDLGWRADVGVSGGLLVPLVRPGVGLIVTPFVAAGPVRKNGFVQGVIAAPLVVAAPGGARLPVLFELQGGGTVGRVSFGPRLAMGAIVAPGTDVSVATEAALLVSVRTR